MATELQSQIAHLCHGDHACLIYETAAEQLAAAVPFLRDGLAAGERCIYITDDLKAGVVVDALLAAGVDVPGEVERGALRIGTGRNSHLASGSLDPAGMVELLGEQVERARDAGFSGLRITGEMTWTLATPTGSDLVLEYEALLNQHFPGSSSLAICQYRRDRFPAEVIHDVLRTHPVAILDGQVCPNLYYEPPEVVFSGQPVSRRVEWMISQLKRARAAEQAIQQARLAKSEFLATVSHELRTPLNVIVGYSDLLKAEIGGTLAPPQMEQVERIESSAQQLLGLIEEILFFSRLEAGREEIVLEPTDPCQMTREVVALVEPLASKKGLRLGMECRAEPAMVAADAGKIRQILLNLLSNAVKFTDAGRIEVRVEANEQEIVLAVADTGIGIAAGEREAIFEAFRQVDSGLTRRAGGTGLGLTVVRRLVDLLGGHISVESATGSGSRFVVRIPVSPAPQDRG